MSLKIEQNYLNIFILYNIHKIIKKCVYVNKIVYYFTFLNDSKLMKRINYANNRAKF